MISPLLWNALDLPMGVAGLGPPSHCPRPPCFGSGFIPTAILQGPLLAGSGSGQGPYYLLPLNPGNQGRNSVFLIVILAFESKNLDIFSFIHF